MNGKSEIGHREYQEIQLEILHLCSFDGSRIMVMFDSPLLFRKKFSREYNSSWVNSFDVCTCLSFFFDPDLAEASFFFLVAFCLVETSSFCGCISGGRGCMFPLTSNTFWMSRSMLARLLLRIWKCTEVISVLGPCKHTLTYAQVKDCFASLFGFESGHGEVGVEVDI